MSASDAEAPVEPDPFASGGASEPSPPAPGGVRDPSTGRFQPRGDRPIADPRPRKRGKRPKAKAKAPATGGSSGTAKQSTRQRTLVLEAALAKGLVFPAVPAAMFSPDEVSQTFLVQHFMQSGPATAKQLALASEASPQLREILEGMAKGSVSIMIAVALVGYAVPPVAWMLGARQLAQAASAATSMDPDRLEELAAMLRADGYTATVVREPGSEPGAAAPEQTPPG